MSSHQAISSFKWIARLEGTSYLLLLFIAMPLKYLAGMPEWVLYVGWAHGALFVAYGLTLLWVWVADQWSFGKAFLAGVASLLPGGTFWFEKKHLNPSGCAANG
jgi:integral membrane protein